MTKSQNTKTQSVRVNRTKRFTHCQYNFKMDSNSPFLRVLLFLHLLHLWRFYRSVAFTIREIMKMENESWKGKGMRRSVGSNLPPFRELEIEVREMVKKKWKIGVGTRMKQRRAWVTVAAAFARLKEMEALKPNMWKWTDNPTPTLNYLHPHLKKEFNIPSLITNKIKSIFFIISKKNIQTSFRDEK